jgi:hypothetical protein
MLTLLLLTIALLIIGGLLVNFAPAWNSAAAKRLITRWAKALALDQLGGYVHDTAMSQFIPPNAMSASAGTWTMAVASNVWSNNRTANDSSFTLYIPIPVPSNSAAQKGAYLKSVEFMYSIGTADADDITTLPKLYKDTLQATAASGSGTLNAAAEVTSTLDTGHDTAAELKVQDEHRVKVTVTTPAWIDNDEAYHVEMVVDAAAGTVFKFFGAIANYTLRV